MDTNYIKNLIEEILKYVSSDAYLKEVTEINNGEIVKFSVVTEEPYLLLGEDGKNLLALNHIVKKIAEVKFGKNKEANLNFIVDINDYQERRIQDIKNKAHIMAERARFFKSSVELSPMNPYERMIVHTLFSGALDIETESTGFGRERRVVIKYVAN